MVVICYLLMPVCVWGWCCVPVHLAVRDAICYAAMRLCSCSCACDCDCACICICISIPFHSFPFHYIYWYTDWPLTIAYWYVTVIHWLTADHCVLICDILTDPWRWPLRCVFTHCVFGVREKCVLNFFIAFLINNFFSLCACWSRSDLGLPTYALNSTDVQPKSNISIILVNL